MKGGGIKCLQSSPNPKVVCIEHYVNCGEEINITSQLSFLPFGSDALASVEMLGEAGGQCMNSRRIVSRGGGCLIDSVEWEESGRVQNCSDQPTGLRQSRLRAKHYDRRSVLLTAGVSIFLLMALAFGEPVYADTLNRSSMVDVPSSISGSLDERSNNPEKNQNGGEASGSAVLDPAFDITTLQDMRSSDSENILRNVHGPQRIRDGTLSEKTKFKSDGGLLIYATSQGTYVFNSSKPHVVRFTDGSGRTLAEEAIFRVFAPDSLAMEGMSILETTEEKHITEQTVLKDGSHVGDLMVAYDFSYVGPPKVTARFNFLPGISRFDFNIVWTIDSRLDCVSTYNSSPNAVTDKGVIFFRGVDHSNISLQYCKQHYKHRPSMVIDWSDGPGEEITLTRIETIEYSITRVSVTFPLNQNTIDPSLVSSSYNPPPYDPYNYDRFYSMQRNIIYLDGYYWIFYVRSDDTVDQLYFSVSSDGLNWGPMRLALDLNEKIAGCDSVNCGIDYGLDIAGRSGMIVISFSFWASTNWYFGVVMGNIAGLWFTNAEISWVPIDQDEIDPFCGLADAQSVIIDSIGQIWTSVSYLRPLSNPLPDWMLVSSIWRMGRTGWEEMEKHEVFADERNSVIHTTLLVPLSHGKVARIWAESDDTYLRWMIWDNGWSDEDNIDARFAVESYALSRARRMSAVSLSDDTLIVVYGYFGDFETAWGIERVKITETASEMKLICDFTLYYCESRYLTASRDAADAVFVYWTRGDELVRYWFEMGQWESEIEENLQADGPQPRISSSFLATKYSLLTWSVENSGLWFASWPTPSSLSSSNPAPWMNLGTDPILGKYSHLDESISPSNGLLFIKSTDLVVPGKNGLDAVVARIFRTPPLFREDFYSGIDVPYIFGDSPYADMGNGWELNYPWIERSVLYLWDGMRFVLSFPEDEEDPEKRDTFTNHIGLHFTVKRNQEVEGESNCIVLTLKSGMTYIFHEDGRLKFIQNKPSTQTRLAFYYDEVYGRLEQIQDTLGRFIDFELTGEKLTGLYLQNILEVSFAYDSDGNLEFVTDAVQRKTEYEYSLSNKHLLSYVIYSTLLVSEYEYQELQRGTDAHFFVVTEHRLKDKMGAEMRKDSFEYKQNAGSMSFTRIKRYGTDAVERCDEYVFDTPSNTVTTIQRDGDPVNDGCSSRYSKSKMWYDSKGQLRQTDYYIGDSGDVSSSVSFEYDEWGNLIYQRDATGHEVWSSYANTKTQNSFNGGGTLLEVENHNLVSDDFIERDLSDWKKDFDGDPPEESNHLSEEDYYISPPSFVVDASSTGFSRPFEEYTNQLWIEIAVKVRGAADHDIFVLDKNDNPRIRLTFNHHGFVCYNHPSDMADPWKRTNDVCNGLIFFEGQTLTYQQDYWYVLGIHLHTNTPTWGSYDIYLNGTRVMAFAPIYDYGSLTFKKLFLREEAGLDGKMWIDSVTIDDFEDPTNPGVYSGIRINGLDEGQYGELFNYNGYPLDRKRADQSGTIDLQWWKSDRHEWEPLRYGQIILKDPDGAILLDSPFRVSGAKHFDFVQPRQESSLHKSVSGFDEVKVDPDNCQWRADGRCILLDEGLSDVVLDEDFHNDWLDLGVFEKTEWGAGSVETDNGWLILSGGLGAVTGGARIRSWDSFSLSSGRMLVFEGSMEAYSDDLFPGVYDNFQPRGLRMGSDPNNAIEFWSYRKDAISTRTMYGGSGTIKIYYLPDGKEVKDNLIYRIEATSNEVKFYVDDILAATHNTNIPQGSLNLFLETEKVIPILWTDLYLKADWLRLEVMDVEGWAESRKFRHSDGDEWDQWSWPERQEVLGAHGDSAHKSSPLSLERHHEFQGSAEPVPLLDDGSTDIIAQYVFIPEGNEPSEIMLRYWCPWPEWIWNSGIYWGEDVIDVNPRSRNGDMPESDRWTLLLISPGSVQCAENFLGGVQFLAYGGKAYWDYSILRDVESTPVTIVGADLQNGWWVKFYNIEDDELTAVQVVDGGAIIDVYDPPLNERTFPLEGYFKIYDDTESELIYWSPTYDRIWPGDEFTFTLPDFYPNDEILSIDGYQDHPLGRLEFRFGRLNYGAEEDPVKSFFQYDGHLLTGSKAFDGIGWLKESYEYDSVHENLLIHCDYPMPGGCQSGHETHFTYSSQYSHAYLTEVKKRADGTEITSEYGYDTRTGQQTHEVDPNGGRTDYDYDGVGRLTKVTHPQIGSDPRAFESFDYDDFYTDGDGIDLTHTNEIGRETKTVFDELGRTASIARLDDSSNEYDKETFEYNWQDDVSVHALYTGLGAPIREYVYEYDCVGRRELEDYPDPLADRTFVYHDAAKSVEVRIESTDEDWQTKEYFFDWANRLVSVLEHDGLEDYVTNYLYDELGNLIKMTDAKAKAEETHFEYDSLSRLTKVTYWDDKYERFEYDGAGDLYEFQDRRGITSTYTYDTTHRLTRKDYSASNKNLRILYDNNDNILEQSIWIGDDQISTESYSYDAWDRIIWRDVHEERESSFGTLEFNMQLDFLWDEASNLERMVIFGDEPFQVDYSYDYFDRLDVVSTPIAGWIAEFDYNEDDSVKDLDYGNGLEMTYEYYTSGMTKEILLRRPQSNIMRLYYTYMDDGALDTLTYYYGSGSPQGTLYYEYDDLNRLKEFSDTIIIPPVEEYTYDEVGNRETKTNELGTFDYHYTDYSNRLESIDWIETGDPFPYFEFEYDDNGNLIRKTNNNPGYTMCFDYDEENQLGAFRFTNGIPPSCQEVPITQEYFYDASGRRVMKATNDQIVKYGYAGSLPVFIRNEATGESTYLVWANDILIGDFNIVGEGRYYHQDDKGNVRVVTDDAQPTPNILFRTNYLPFGEQFQTLEVSSPWLKYGGKEKDESTQLYYFGARYYDPEIGRFVAEDPVRGHLVDPQTLNQYAFAVNRPLTFTDSTGRDVWEDIANWILFPVKFLFNPVVQFMVDTVDWWQSASNAERWGFVSGILMAFAVGILMGFAVGAFCAVTFGGCSLLFFFLAGMAASYVGSLVSGATYAIVTIALGGTPSEQGLALSMAWGGIAGSAGFGVGYRIGYTPRWPKNPAQMKKMLGGLEGKPIKDVPGGYKPHGQHGTPGRGLVRWKISSKPKKLIEYARHPYFKNAPKWHQKFHWAYRPGQTQGRPWERIPEKIVQKLQAEGYLSWF
jgi:RHS repeat-associated protein